MAKNETIKVEINALAKKESKAAAQPTAEPAKKKEAFAPGSMLAVTCTHEGFRRGGRAWSTSPTTVRADEFTPEQLRQIKDEPRLTVEVVKG